MAPPHITPRVGSRGAGGRPRNAWTPTRERALIRLYTLTNLTAEDIGVALSTKDFKAPSRRDVQSKLQHLLPASNKAERLRYRPPRLNPELRYFQMKRCKHGRVMKQRARSGRAASQACQASSRLSSSIFSTFEGDAAAFINYKPLRQKSSTPNNQLLNERDAETINPSLLMAHGPNFGMILGEDAELLERSTSGKNASSAATSEPQNLSWDLKDSYKVDPRLLMLDGSSVISELNPSTQDTAQSLQIVPYEETSRDEQKRDFKEHGRSLITNERHASSTSKLSLSSLKQCLGGKIRDSAILQRAHFALRYSTTDSDISTGSFRSLINFRDSWTSERSFHSVIPHRQSEARDPSTLSLTGSISRKNETLDRYSSRIDSSQKIPNRNLVHDEDQKFLDTLMMSHLFRRVILDRFYVSPLNRRCCKELRRTLALDSAPINCQDCNLSYEHHEALRLAKQPYLPTAELQALCVNAENTHVDAYGNTLLHCVAATIDPSNLLSISYWIDRVSYAEQLNTLGQNFMHSFSQSGIDGGLIWEYINTLRCIQTWGFPLNQQDYHGCSILHTFFDHSQPCMYDVASLHELFSVVEPLHYDNQGRTTLDCLITHVRSLGNTGVFIDYQYKIKALVMEYPRALSKIRRTYLEAFSHMGRAELIDFIQKARQDNQWREWSHLSWIDQRGDNPLSGLLKAWIWDDGPDLKEAVRALIDLGCNAHMKDRNGHAPLIIAAMMGFQSIVLLLLDMGANVHTQDYEGHGILYLAEKVMTKARRSEDGKLYARIWSCHMALIDAGATSWPSREQEWMLPSARSHFNA